MKLVPLGDRVVLKQVEAEETTASGIVLPGQAQEKPQQAEVIAVGPGGIVDGKEVTMQVKEGQKVILGVSFGWGIKKGLDCFIRLASELDENLFKIVLVGTDDEIDKNLPQNIISIHRTQNQKELAEIYSAADVFVMPTREENYPTVNMEAIACGTPVVTFDTGGSPEMLDDKTGIVVEANDIEATKKALKDICEKKRCNDEEYIVAYSKNFDMKKRFAEYIELYANVLEE